MRNLSTVKTHCDDGNASAISPTVASFGRRRILFLDKVRSVKKVWRWATRDQRHRLAEDGVKSQGLWFLDKVRSVKKSLAMELQGTNGIGWRKTVSKAKGSGS